MNHKTGCFMLCFSIIGLVLSLPARSLPLVDVSAGVGAWVPDISGQLGSGAVALDVADDLNLSPQTGLYLWADINHAVPILPHARIEMHQWMAQGTARVEAGRYWDVNVPDAQADFTLDFAWYDLIAYWELPVPTVDIQLGLSARWLDSTFSYQQTQSNQSDRARVSVVLPMLYGALRWPLPLPGLNVELGGSVDWLAYGNSQLVDWSVYTRYLYALPQVDLGMELGYQAVQFTIDSDDFGDHGLQHVDADLQTDGIYVGVVAQF